MEDSGPIRLLIADDHQLFRSGIISLLEDVSDIVIIGEARNGKELIEQYFNLKPDIILTDISMPELSGTEAIKQIKRKDRNAKALILTMHEGEEYVFLALKIGAKGLLSKNTMKGELIYAIKTINDGKTYFGKIYDEEKLSTLENKYKQMAAKDFEQPIKFQQREEIILKSIGEGMTSQEIADILNCSKKTVDYHRSRLMMKLNVKTLPELISFAVKFSMANKLLEE